MISAGFNSAGVGPKSCSKLLNGSNLMDSMPEFFESLQSLIGISPVLNILVRSDAFNLNHDGLELRYSSTIEEDLELTIVISIAWKAVFPLLGTIFRSILSSTY